MKKVILQTAGAFEWETVGIFDSEEDVLEYIAENWGVSFEDDKKENPDLDLHDWYEVMELNVIHTEEK